MTENLVEPEKWQRAEIAAGLAEAERGEFSSHAEVKRVFGKFKTGGATTPSPSPRRLRGEA